MSEVPEYLLQRSKARRRALGLPVDDDDGGAPADGGGGGGAVAATGGGGGGGSAPTQLAPIEPKDTPPPPPEPAYVTAARTRKKPPIWVSALFVMLPVYLFVYVALLGEEAADTETALGIGAELYGAQCATCTSATVAARPRAASARPSTRVRSSAPSPTRRRCSTTSATGSVAAGEQYGDPDREGGVRVAAGGMPGFANLTDYELYAIVRHEREVLSGEEIDDAEFTLREELWTELNEDGGTHGTFAETVVGAAEASG